MSNLLIWAMFGLVALGVIVGMVIAIYLLINTLKNNGQKY